MHDADLGLFSYLGRSDLNVPLDFSSERWGLDIHDC